jgi:hypothetical protein
MVHGIANYATPTTLNINSQYHIPVSTRQSPIWKKLLWSKYCRLGSFTLVQEAPDLSKDGPSMTITPFLALKLRGKKDAILARQRARRVASLLCFDPHEQACIAAGVFIIACQALTRFGKAQLCFQLENQQLHVFAEPIEAKTARQQAHPRLQGLFPDDPKPVVRLVKPLPPRDNPAEEIELGWLVRQVEKASGESLFDEIVKQNQEILALLHELRLYRGVAEQKQEKSRPPHAA